MTINLLAKCFLRSQILKKNYGRKIDLDNFKLSSSSYSLFLTNNLTYKNYSTNRNNNNSSSSKSKNKFYSITYRRWYSKENGTPPNKLPPLMNFPEIVWPSILKSIRNFVLSTFIIKPYFDHDFNLPDFVKGSKKALEVVSNKIAEGDLKSLNGLITSDVLPSLQQSISTMSLPQREQLAINKDDIYFSFPYQVQVGIMFNDDEGKGEKRFVEITMVYHTLRGLSAMRSRGEEPPLNMGMVPEYQKRILICNYRFIREYTKGIDSDWTVNLLNHFKPSDQLNET